MATCGGPGAGGDVDLVGFCAGSEARFCEVVVTTGTGGSPLVYNSWGCNYCPDFNGIAVNSSQHKIGPYFMQPDTLTLPPPEGTPDEDGNREVRLFTSVQMQPVATKLTSAAGYSPFQVKRDTRLKWAPRRQVYQLVTDEGVVYTMHMSTGQTQFSQDLLTLGNAMQLPPGFSHRCKVLGSSGLELITIGIATVMMDSNMNVYSLTPEPSSSDCAPYADEECIVETEQTRRTHCAAGAAAVAAAAAAAA